VDVWFTLTIHQFPAAEVKDLHNQVLQTQEELHIAGISHEGKSAEEAYAERLAQMHLEEGVIQDGPKVVSTVLQRCLLWVEIVEERSEIL